MFQKAILHLDMDAFFVSVEYLRDSSLKGLPLAIGGTSDRGVIAACSYEARRFGIHAAMPVKMARRLCPDLIIMKGDMDIYTKHSRIITEIIREQAPLFEKASIDEFYLDLSGMDEYIGCSKWAVELREYIMEQTGLPISFGLSANKMVSKVGTGEAKPNGTKIIDTGGEKAFLHPLAVSKIPGLGKKTSRKLSFMGVRTIRILSQIPVQLLQREFGKNGKNLWLRANGIDDSPVVPYCERKSISTEKTFQVDTIDVRQIHEHLTRMGSRLAFELRQSQKLTSCISVKIRYSDFNTYSRQRKINYTANDKTLLSHIHQLFDQLYQRRQLVRLVGIKFSGLVSGSYQINLFDDTMEEVSLLRQMDHIRKRFGKNAIMRANTLK